MESIGNLFWVVTGFIAMWVVMLGYCVMNFNDIKAEHTKLKDELAHRLFFRQNPQSPPICDLKQIISALLEHEKLRIHGTSGIQLIKDGFEKKK